MAAPLPASGQTTALFLDSEPGDVIGQGRQQTLTATDVKFSVVAATSIDVTIRVGSPTSRPWVLRFQASDGMMGSHEEAGIASLVSRGAGLEITTAGRGCRRVVGRFHVYEMTFSSPGTLATFAADFEQHCEDQGPALFGALRYNSSRPSLIPFNGMYPMYSLRISPSQHGTVVGDGFDCGQWSADCEEIFATPTTVTLQAIPRPGSVFVGWAGLDCTGDETAIVQVSRQKRCSPIFGPAAGRRTFEVQDYNRGLLLVDGPVGNGESTGGSGRRRHAFTARDSRFSANMMLDTVLVTIEGPRGVLWTVRFSGPRNTSIAPGDYENTSAGLASGPFPALAIAGGDLACTGGGRFRIHELELGLGLSLARFSADFEQPCNGGVVTGLIRYGAVRTAFVPFEDPSATHSIQVSASQGGYVTASGIQCGDTHTDCDETFPSPTRVALQAHALTGYEFLVWGGNCASASTTVEITVDRPRQCAAVFTPTPGSNSPADPTLATQTLFLDVRGSNLASTRWAWLAGYSTLRVTTGNGIVFLQWLAPSIGGVDMAFGLPGGRLVPGSYVDAWPVPGALRYPYLDVSFCTERAGRFQVHEVTYDSADRVIQLAADFEVHCADAAMPYVAGSVRFAATRGNIRPFDGAYPLYSLRLQPSPHGIVTGAGLDCGPGAHADCREDYANPTTLQLRAVPLAGYKFAAWTGSCEGSVHTSVDVPWVKTCSAAFSAVPFTNHPTDPRLASSSFLIDSRPGDALGEGRRHLWLDEDLRPSGSNRRIASVGVRAPQGQFWIVSFRAPGTEELVPGTYENATDNTSGPATNTPGLSVHAPQTFCSPRLPTGRFVVYEVVFGSTPFSLLAFAADFEFRCSPQSPPLFGSIRYHSSRSELKPFAPTQPPADLTGDRWADLILQNRTDGRIQVRALAESGPTSDLPLTPGQVDAGWKIVGSGDANRDGHPDLYWHHPQSGTLAVWFMEGTVQRAAAWLTPAITPDANWQVQSTADMDQDGYPDFLWQHLTTGELVIWFMTANERRAAVALGQLVDLEWAIAAAADVNGDHYPDLLWHNVSTGALRVWYMQGQTRLAEEAFVPDRLSDTSWRLRGAVDLDRNGYPDLIWQNTTTFEIGAWLLEGVNVIGGQWLGPPLASADWYLVSPK
jgi:FG-GAP-like repeat/Divergent InlB B-repeat domain